MKCVPSKSYIDQLFVIYHKHTHGKSQQIVLKLYTFTVKSGLDRACLYITRFPVGFNISKASVSTGIDNRHGKCICHIQLQDVITIYYTPLLFPQFQLLLFLNHATISPH